MVSSNVDVLLAHPFFLANDAKQLEKMRPYPPLGTLYAASRLRRGGYRVALFDATFAADAERVEEALEREVPRYFVIYEDTFNFLNKMCLSHAREAACRMAESAAGRGLTVIAAGSDVSDHPEAYFARGVEYALLGEADETVAALLDTLSGRSPTPVDEIPGVARPEPGAAGGVHRGPQRPPERRPDRFPFPAWDLLDVEAYRRAWTEAHGYFSLNMVTTRGCPFHCNWCAKPIWGQRYAMRSPANVAEEMALLKETLRPDRIWFADDIFGLQPRWVGEFSNEVQRLSASIPFTIQSRVDLMTEKAVASLARAGCVEVWLGVESGSQKILDAMDKGTRLEQIPVARERLRAAGIRACFFIQFGYPGELLEDIRATLDLMRRTMPDDVGVSVSYPLPGTSFHDMVAAQLGDKTHWQESNELAMMFQGTYTTEFYRRLHRMVHEELDLRQRLAAGDSDERALLGSLDRLELEWRELERTEAEHRSVEPTRIRKHYPEPEAPDLSRLWN